jgi:serine/threonine protein kinase
MWEEVKETSKYLIPSSYLFYLIEDIIHAVQYLQEEKKVRHDNINPWNILIFEGPLKSRPLCAKLSNISSHSTSVLRNPKTGTSGWKFREELIENEDVDERADLFALGLVVYSRIMGGLHPFGDLTNPTNCDTEITKNTLILPPRNNGVVMPEIRDFV